MPSMPTVSITSMPRVSINMRLILISLVCLVYCYSASYTSIPSIDVASISDTIMSSINITSVSSVSITNR